MENQNQQPSAEQPIQQSSIQQQVVPPTKSNQSKLFLIIIFILLVTIPSGIYLLSAKNINQQKQTVIVPTITPTIAKKSIPARFQKPPTPAQIIDQSGIWKTFTIKTVGMSFGIPLKSNAQNELVEEILPGQKGKKLDIHPKVYKGDNEAAYDAYDFKLGTTSIDFEQGREGQFTDFQGFTVENGKYFAKFVASQKIELPSFLVMPIENKNGVKIIRIIGKNGIDSPMVPGLREGWIGALINTNNETFPGLAIQMNLSIADEKTFDQILSTFKFTN